jgi:hypothetical protein
MAYQRTKQQPNAVVHGRAVPAIRASGEHSVREYARENARPTPLEKLVLELVLVRACSGDVVAEVAAGPGWTGVTRGPAALDPTHFRVIDYYADTQGIIAR